jgi:L-fuculose-phosphate aldolase
MDTIFKLKQQMCDIGHRIWLKGFCGGNEGNHSIRIDNNRVLCTPTGVSKGFLTPDMICLVDMNGNQLDRDNKYRVSSEVKIHLALYKHDTNVKSVVHSHPPHATAFALANIPLPEGFHPEAEVFLGRVPIAEYATPSKQELADSLIPCMGPNTSTILMGNHGAVCYSRKDLIDAYYRMEILDAYSRILLLTKQLGQINQLSPKQMTDLLEVKAKFGFPDERLACSAAGCVGSVNDAEFEAMVQKITDQIMAAAR